MSTEADGQVSFVVRTRNEERYVGHAIQSILDFFGTKTHIIIVDNESTDDTLKNVSLFPKRFYNVDKITIGYNEYTPGRSLNMGIEKTNAPIVGILSAHCQIRHLVVDDLLTYFNEVGVFGVIGKQIPIYKGKKIHPRYIWSNFCHETPQENLVEATEEGRHFFHNAFSFNRRDIWEHTPFDEDLHGKEDRFWADKLVSQGCKFYLEPDFICDHNWTQNGATWINIG